MGYFRHIGRNIWQMLVCIGHFDIKWSLQIQMNFQFDFLSAFRFDQKLKNTKNTLKKIYNFDLSHGFCSHFHTLCPIGLYHNEYTIFSSFIEQPPQMH